MSSSSFLTNNLLAKTAKEIDAVVDVAIERFYKQVKGAEKFVKASKGMLVMPNIVKGAFIVGGEYGEGALKKFRASKGWEAGVDGNVALISVGAGERADTTTLKDPIVGFVFDAKGLIADISLKGAKFSKIDKKE